jgi:hypothetical protein
MSAQRGRAPAEPRHDAGTAARAGPRRLIAGLRVTQADLALIAVVRPYLADVDSEGELAYRLWRRGLEVTLAELAGLGVAVPNTLPEDHLATLAAQRLLLVIPLLRRTGKLILLGLDAPISRPAPRIAEPEGDQIDASAAGIIVGLGGDAFL